MILPNLLLQSGISVVIAGITGDQQDLPALVMATSLPLPPPRPAEMHRCLKIAEIVEMICFHLDPRFFSGPLEETARPYRDFAVVAPSKPLLWIICGHRRNARRSVGFEDTPVFWKNQTRLRLLRPIRVSDWDRLRSYARRVKELSSGSGGWVLTVLPTLSVSLPRTLFSNLQSLTWHNSKGDFHYIHLFLHPTITKIYFSLSSDSESSSLSALPQTCPKLTDVFSSTHEYDSRSVSKFVHGLQHAKRISVHSLDPDVLEYLSHHPTLESLALHEFSTVLTFSPESGGQTCPALDDLSLAYPAIAPTIQFLGLCRDVSLRTVNIDLYEFATAAQIHGFYTALAGGISHSSLINLTMDISCTHDDQSDPDTYLITPRSLRLLLCFTNLTKLSLASPLGFDLDNDAVSELARGWPRIGTLLLPVRFPTHAPRATFASLASFALHCLDLRTLAFAVDATTVPSPPRLPSTRLVQYTLDLLDVGHSPLGEPTPISVTRFLSAVFPSLESIMTRREWEDNNDENELLEQSDAIRLHNRWKDVEALLPDVLAIREEGRLLAQEAYHSSS